MYPIKSNVSKAFVSEVFMTFTVEKRKKPKNPALVIGVINQKGGVGKTTTAVNLSAVLGDKGYTVLLVDLDPQGNSTSGLGFDKSDCELSSYDCLLNDDFNPSDAIADLDTKNVKLIPATIDLAGAEAELVQAIARETRLKDALDAIQKENDCFDFVIIDCPPSLGMLTINALTAAQELIIPIQSEFYALEGLSKIIDSVNMVKKRLNPDLEILGVLLTMYDKRTALAQQVASQVTEFFGDRLFDTKIPRTVRISEAPSFGQSILEYDPEGKGAKAYRKLGNEVIDRYQEIFSKK